MNKIQRKLVVDQLTNNENASDNDLVMYFIGAGLSIQVAEFWVSKRKFYLNYKFNKTL